MLVHSLLLLIALSCSCTEVPVSLEPPAAPSIHLNSVHLPNQTEIVLNAGSNFSLSCHGNSTTHWSSTAFLLVNKEELANPLGVNNSVPKHTGTYRCGYTRQGLDHLDNWIHLYIKDPAHSASVFVTPRKAPETIKEGEDFLFKCLLTDPSVKNLTLQTEGSIGGKGWGLPQGMNVTLDPRRGALIRNLQRSFSGRYVCSGWMNGTQFRSKSFNLFVAPRLPPPALSISQDEFVRLEGERFEVTCLTSNPSHHYYLTWTHPNIQTLNVTKSRNYINNRLHINGTLTISAVSLNHSGPYTCSAFSEDGVTTATTQLRVLDRPYLRTYLQLTQHANATTTTIEVEDLFANVSITSVKKEPDTNISFGWKGEDIAGSINISGSIRVEVYEGQDVTLTFVIEAYPPIRNQDWTTPTHTSSNNNTAYQESYTANGYRSEASLLLRRVRHEDQGRYLFHFSNSFFSRMQNIDVQIYRSPTAVVNLQNDTLTCTSSGYPLPTIRWYTCARLQDMCGDVSINHMSPMAVTSWEEEGEEEVRSHLPLSAGDDITVCVASNQLGDSRDVFSPWTTPNFAGEPQTLFTVPLIAALSTAAILLLLLLFVSHRWRQKPKYEIRWKIIESSDGNNYTFIDPAQLPYNQKWEFPRDKLCFGAVLGSGAFGKVVEATAYGLGTDDNITRVAVKMLKPSAHSEERDALMSELKILSHLGYHDNIVNLLGACTQGGPMLMITEYCSHGDLLNFLRAHAHDFMSSILSVDEMGEQIFYKNMGIQSSRLRSDSGISCCSEYQEMLPVLTSGQTLGGQTGSLSFSDLMRFSYQVAQGLDFLSTRNCIHRDVAARNILLTDRRVAKICDFGLARDIRNDDSYIVQGNARLPVKWMAPESIFQCVYTVQSDVWSYGVLLWEIFSLGKSPYPNIAVDTNFFKMIMDGCHMAQPDFAPAEMYELMTLCWNLEPTARPTFKTIGQLINRLLPSTSDTSTHHSHQLMYRNIDECREEEEEEEEKRKEKH